MTAVKSIKSAEQRQTRKYIKKITAETSTPKSTRGDSVDAAIDEQEIKWEHRFGLYLLSAHTDARHFFKRVSNWSRDQTITKLTPSSGRTYSAGTSRANVMAGEWHHIIGRNHATVSEDQRERLFDKLLQVPASKRATKSWNDLIMAPIQPDDVETAIKSLQRHKAAGLDGLPNDFYKDCELELVPTLISLYNQLLNGAEMPASFADSLIIPLRKKGDSDNAMDYRPISLLQSSYKIFAKILAVRVQAGLDNMIGATQQGFVHARLLERSVVLMQAMLQQAYEDEKQSIDDAPAVVLLDFMKAYDTLDRNFILLALKKFGFSTEFVRLIDKMHQGTTAQFSVNGELSDPNPVLSGIRQGCPLAPLLFIIAAEVLALMIDQNRFLTGISLPGSSSGPVKMSAFVDDSAVFLRRGAECPHLLRLLEDFKTLSGLKVQPQKSVFISLNKCVQQKSHFGIPVLPTGHTTRYLGVQIGTEDSTTANWEGRLRSIQVRLAMAARVSNSIVGKVKILNAIMLPAVLFTAQFVKPPEATVKRLVNMQKQFLWKGQLRTDGTKHKINPELLFSPVSQGGVGLQAIPLAIKRQAMRRATQWLLADRTIFTEAWHSLAHRDKAQTVSCCTISPRVHTPKSRAKRYRSSTIQQLGVDFICDHLVESNPKPDEWKHHASTAVQRTTQAALLLWDEDGSPYLQLDAGEPQVHQTSYSHERARFWPLTNGQTMRGL